MVKTKIELRNVFKIYTGWKEDYVKALDDISLSLNEKEMVFVVGPSGSGKTTLLNLIGGLDNSTRGEIFYLGHRINDMKKSEYYKYLKNDIAFVFQEFFLIENMTVFDNLQIALSQNKDDSNTIAKKIEKALFKVGLVKYEKRIVNELSGGEKQRVAIARAIIKNAKLILCDEPTGNLDKKNAISILNILSDLSENSLVVVVTHDETLVKDYADRMIRLSNGHIIEDIFFERKKSIDNKDIREKLDEQKNRLFKQKNNVLCLFINNVKYNLFSILFSVFILCLSFVALISFIAISNYNSYDTFIDTLEYNQQYILKVTSYVDNSIFIDDDIYIYGVYPTYEKIDENSKDEIELLTGNLLSTYNSYYFYKNFQDFIDFKVEADEYGSYSNNDIYQTSYWTDMIIVDDFSEFHQPLAYGTYPKEENEVIIYDYMAQQLINTDALTDVNSMEDLIDYVLIDKDTNLHMKISGILESDYLKYSYISGGKVVDFPFESIYISELQSIFALPSFKEIVDSENEYISINSLSIYNVAASQVSDDAYFHKIMLLNSVDSLDLILPLKTDYGYGVILSNYQLASMLGLSVSEINSELLDGNLEARVKSPLLFQKAYLSSIISIPIPIIGVYDSEELNSDYIYAYYPDESSTLVENGSFRNMYLSLSDDWDTNKEALINFQHPEEKDISFYYSNPTYEDTGYMEYSPYTSLILEADEYMQAMRNIGQITGIVLVVLTCFIIINYAYKTIKKNSFKIGVLKSLGFSDFKISSIFGFEIILMMIFSFLLSIGPTLYLTKLMNDEFTKIIGIDLIFFSVNIDYFIISLLITLLIAFISTFIPFFFLIQKTPIRIIIKSNAS